MAKRRHEEHEEHADESWLLPYSDLMTLLVALFIVLYAASNIDIVKYNDIMSGLYQSFNGNPPIIDSSSSGQSPGTDMSGYGDVLVEPTSAPDDNMGEGELDDLGRAISEYISENNLGDVMSLGVTPDGILISLKSDVWFASGSAQITSAMSTTASSLSSLIAKTDASATADFNEKNAVLNGPNAQKVEHLLQVIVTGHTDNLAISNAQFRSNWHLSLARAVNFMVLILDNTDLDPRMFSARGYGEYKPVATNDTPEGRQQNRRVEVYIPKPQIPIALP